MPGPVAEALMQPVAGKPGGGMVADLRSRLTAPLDRRMNMSQGELLGEFLRNALMFGPMALGPRGANGGGWALPTRPDTVGVSMPPGAANLPPWWRIMRQGYGKEPMGPNPNAANVNSPVGRALLTPIDGGRP